MGSTFVKIALQADVGGFVKGFAQADTVAGKFGATVSGITNVAGAVGSALDQMAQKAQTFAKHVAAGGVAGTLFFGGLGIAAARLEQPLKNVQTIMGQGFGKEQFEAMTNTVINMSKRLPQSATDLANGLYNIASSGFYGSDALKVLDVSATAAAAGLTTTQNASTAVTAALNAYGKGAGSAKDMSDIMFQTVNLGVVSFEQLTGVIGDAVGTAAAAGVSFDQVGSAIATMTRSGISAEESGTSLNRLLQSLIDPSESLGGALHALGYESGASALETDGLYKVMMKLMTASKGNISTLMEWFPEIRAARGALALMANQGATYGEVVDQIENKQNRAGATQRAFNIQMESTAAAFTKLINNVKAVGLEIGQAFLPAARVLINFATGLVQAFDSIPGPIKEVIGWVGALSSVIVALGGIYAAWALKSAVTRVAMNFLGQGAQRLGTTLGESGRVFTEFGNRATNLTAPFAVTRTMLGTTTAMFGSFGNALTGLGGRVQDLGGRMSFGGQFVSSFGSAMTKASQGGHLLVSALGKVGSGLAGLVGYAPAALALGVALYSAFQNGKSGAQEFVAEMNKGLNEKNPDSLSNHYDKLIKKHTELVKDLQSGVPDSGSGILGFIKQVGVNMADLTTNVAGIDVVKTSSWDKAFKIDEMSKSEQKIMRTMQNLQKNTTEIFNILHPDKKLEPGTVLGVNSDDIRYISRVAEQAGIDLTNSFKKSGPARQAAMTEIQRITGVMSAMGGTSGVVSEAMIKQYGGIQKASQKAAEGAAAAFQKSFDLFKSVDPNMTWGKILGTDDQTLVPVSQQISRFYDDTIQKATNFYNGIQELQARGANPAVIQKMLQAGPEAAGAIVQAAVEDTTNGVIQTLNAGEDALKGFSARAAEMARLTHLAISSNRDDYVKELGSAMQIANEAMAQGTGATVESVAAALHMTPQDAEHIAGDFGISLAHELTPDSFIPDLGPITDSRFNTPLANMKKTINDTAAAITAWSNTDPATVVSLMDKLQHVLSMPAVTPGDLTKKRIAIEELQTMMAQVPNAQDREVVFRVIGAELAKSQLQDFLSHTKGVFTDSGMPSFGRNTLSQQQIDFVLSVVEAPDAVSQIDTWAEKIQLLPTDKATVLHLIGKGGGPAAAEAEAEAVKIDQAVQALQGKELPITAENVQALLTFGITQQTLDAIKQNQPASVKAKDDTEPDVGNAKKNINSVPDKDAQVRAIVNGLGDVDSLSNRINSLHDRTVTITANLIAANNDNPYGLPPNFFAAQGAIFKGRIQSFAGGGEANREAMVGNGRNLIVWNEPETGGESYIPWARDRRGRATLILKKTAKAFGYDLVRNDIKAYADGGTSGTAYGTDPRWGVTSTGGGNITISSPITFAAPVYGETAMRSIAENVVNERDRELEMTLRRRRSN